MCLAPTTTKSIRTNNGPLKTLQKIALKLINPLPHLFTNLFNVLSVMSNAPSPLISIPSSVANFYTFWKMT